METVHLAADGGLGQNLCGLLEGGGGHEGIGSQRRLGDTHQQLGAHGVAQRLAVLLGLAGSVAAVDLLVGIVQLQDVHHRAVQQLGVAGVLQTHLPHHLADDDLDVLIVDVNALLTVHAQNFLDQIVVHGVGAADAEHVVGVQGAVGQLGTGGDGVAVLHLQTGVRHRVGAGIAVVGGDDNVQQAALGSLLEADLAANLRQSGHTLGLAGLEQLFNTGKALGDVAAGQAAGVERTHGQLGTGLADGLGGNDTNCLAGANRLLSGQVHAVALGAHTAVGLAGQDRADHNGGLALIHGRIVAALVAGAGVLLDPLVGLQELGVLLVHHLGVGHQHLTGLGVHNVAHQEAAPQTVGELLDDLAVLADLGDLDAVGHMAILLTDDDILGDVDHSAGQVTGVGGTQSGIGQALTGAAAGDEVLQGGQALAVVCLDGDLDGLTGGIGD